MGLILVGAIVLILFGTLYPFRFQCPASFDIALQRFDPLTQAISRGDLAGNLILFLPFGLAAAAWAKARPGLRTTALGRFLFVVLLGTALSFGIELAQSCTPRTSSWTDVALNATSAAAGALLLSIVQRFLTRLRSGLGDPDPAALLLIGLFGVWQFAPYVPTIDWQKWRNALRPLLSQPEITGGMVASYGVVWLVLARLAVAALPQGHAVLLWLGLLVAAFGLKLVIVGQSIRLGELTGAIAGLGLATLLVARPGRWRDTLLALLLAGYVVDQGLRPYTVMSGSAPFHWLPFAGYLGGSMFVAVQAIGQKMFCYGGLVWLLWRAGFGLARPAVAAALLVLAIEIVQTRLPGRVAEITDPLLVLIAAWLFYQLGRQTSAAGRAQASAGGRQGNRATWRPAR